MKRVVGIGSALAALLVLGAGLSGCVIAADLLNPQALRTLGFDPDTFRSPPGRVIVIFVNETDQPAIFTAFQQSDPADALTAIPFQVEVDPASEANQVLRCPIGRIGLGSPAATGDNPAALVGATVVGYTGDPVVEGLDYSCGDVIQFTVSAVPGGQAAFVINGQVLPGR